MDYFRWRNEDAHRNALNAHCYWALRKQGHSAGEAAKQLSGRSVAEKNELLFQKGINFNELPAWQKRGVGVYWETYTKAAVERKTGAHIEALRQRLIVDYHLPMKEAYSGFVQSLLAN